MPLTVASIESDLLTLVGPYLKRVGLDGDTADGSNATLRLGIRWAVGRLGLETLDAQDVADADLADVTRATYGQMLRLAELRSLEVIWGNWPEVDQTADSESQSLSQLADRLERRIKALKDELGTLADDALTALIPRPAATGLIRAGRYYPAQPYPESSRGWDRWGRLL